jgi:hypothetical protein
MQSFGWGGFNNGIGDRGEVVIEEQVVCAGGLRKGVDAVGSGIVPVFERHVRGLLGCVSGSGKNVLLKC